MCSRRADCHDPAVTPEPLPMLRRPLDTRGRPLHDLRISVTDRCNFRCVYCMPRAVFGPDHAFLPRDELLTFDEITRLVGDLHPARRREGAAHRRRAARPARAADPGGHGSPRSRACSDLTLTTNGVLLPEHAAALREAGLHRVTISLDADDDETFMRLNDAARAGRQGAGRDRGGRGGRPGTDQAEHGREARLERARHPADGAALPRDRAHPAVHRVHGRRPLQRLAPGRRRHRGRDPVRRLRPSFRWSRCRPPSPARWRSATATPMARARSG